VLGVKRDIGLTIATVDKGNVASCPHKNDNQERPELDLVIAARLWWLRRVRTTALNGHR
jgi:hypothetical protein